MPLTEALTDVSSKASGLNFSSTPILCVGLCEQRRLRRFCAYAQNRQEPSLLRDAISVDISCTGSIYKMKVACAAIALF